MLIFLKCILVAMPFFMVQCSEYKEINPKMYKVSSSKELRGRGLKIYFLDTFKSAPLKNDLSKRVMFLRSYPVLKLRLKMLFDLPIHSKPLEREAPTEPSVTPATEGTAVTTPDTMEAVTKATEAPQSSFWDYLWGYNENTTLAPD